MTRRLKPLITAVFAALTLAILAPAARASTIVPIGSSYSFALLGTGGPGTGSGTATFDGTAETFLYHGLPVTITETQTDLGGGVYEILIQWRASSDIFPVAGGTAFVNVGLFTNPLDLIFPVKLTSAVITLSTPSAVVASGEFIGFVVNPDPWDGFFSASGFAAGYVNAGGRGITSIDLLLTTGPSEVPEPASLTLLGVGLAGMGARRWRQRKTS